MEKNLKILSDRECEILAMLAEGCTIKQIADKLKISESTVEKHSRSMLRKKGFVHPYQLVSWAYSEGVLR
ncbi:response regulator transcription factor [Pontibacter vulgaris]|uniref:response regulator transcription factor n=1 Tax=Pontibacter vulgaris TaxID=2905679 RepID=UPI001FA70308|nr:helix-turn-helix transcriptional regulator [Pontibacter vulgaris]